MKASELRIGNYCYCQGEIREIFGISKDVIVQYLIDEDAYYCGFDETKPIELTEEILLKCGFKKEVFTLNMSYSTVNPYFELTRRHFSVSKVYEKNVRFWGNEIKYLHQLQNLYFALTNEELNVKL